MRDEFVDWFWLTLFVPVLWLILGRVALRVRGKRGTAQQAIDVGSIVLLGIGAVLLIFLLLGELLERSAGAR